MKNVQDLKVNELEDILGVSFERARKIIALDEFLIIPSIGSRFTEDLIFFSYYRLGPLVGEDGANLMNKYEKIKGY